MIVRQGDVNHRLHSFGGHFRKPGCGPTGQMHLWLPGSQIADLHVFPGDPHPQAGAQRFGTGFLGSPSFGIGTSLIHAPFGLGLFKLGKNPVAKAITEPFQSAGDSVDIRKIGADTQYHAGHGNCRITR